MFWSWVLPVLFIAGFSAGDDPPPKANTTLGEVSGSWMKSRGGRTFAAFRTIPYAKPPVKELRFQAPQKLDTKWTEIYDASRKMPVCMQFPEHAAADAIISEDCLYLSVFSHNVSGNAPVLFYIHGGAFLGGTAAEFGPEYMMDEDVVIVETNYRLGVLGFLSFENELVPGNMGMKDQVMALKWVQENIHFFGGNPKKVTIQGASAGGASVYHHIISPRTEGLFHQVIAESGSSYAGWAISPPGVPSQNAVNFMKILNCSSNGNDLKEALACSRNKTTAQLMEASRKQSGPRVYIPLTLPCFEKPGDGAFLTGPPSKWHHWNVTLLIGFTSAEGLLLTAELVQPGRIEQLSGVLDIMLPTFFGFNDSTEDPGLVSKRIHEFYFTNVTNLTMDNWVNLTNMYSEGMFIYPGLEGAHSHSGDVYLYYFDYVTKDAIVGLNDTYVIGAPHTLETAFIWKTKYGNLVEVTRKEDLELSKKLVKIVGNFVKHGSPQMEGIVPKWEKWTKDSQNYVHIYKQNDTGVFSQKSGLNDRAYQFWKGLGLWNKVEKEMGGGGAPSIVICNFLLVVALILSACRLL